MTGEPIRTDASPVAMARAIEDNVLAYVAVGDNARRRGLGTALTLQALDDARDAGYRIVTLRASEMGESMYRRLGFEEYCRIAQYWWVPNAPEG